MDNITGEHIIAILVRSCGHFSLVYQVSSVMLINAPG